LSLIKSPIPARPLFNVYNAIAALRCLEVLDLLDESTETALQTFAGVPGRLNKYELPNGALAFIDYAHNAASFERVLSAMCQFSGDLIVVFGAGGDREPARRPIMGEIASRYASLVILTTDNPRSEDPVRITQAILAGIPEDRRNKVIVELNREAAIKLAYQHSHAESTIMLLGKGPDEYQLVKGVKIPFSERAILQSL
jgi:UDP-N-acetylmuramyl tripeptide synthase